MQGLAKIRQQVSLQGLAKIRLKVSLQGLAKIRLKDSLQGLAKIRLSFIARVKKVTTQYKLQITLWTCFAGIYIEFD